MVLLAAQESRLAPLAISRALRGLAKLWAELPLGDLDERATGGAVPWFREAFGDTDRAGAYWSARDFSASVPDVSRAGLVRRRLVRHPAALDAGRL